MPTSKFLKTVAAEDLNMEDLFLAKGSLITIIDGFREQEEDAPEWAVEQLTFIERTISTRLLESRMRRLKTLKAQRAAMGTPEEKRGKLDDSIAALEKKLT